MVIELHVNDINLIDYTLEHVLKLLQLKWNLNPCIQFVLILFTVCWPISFVCGSFKVPLEDKVFEVEDCMQL